jgi:NADPH-dependent F420 reductase
MEKITVKKMNWPSFMWSMVTELLYFHMKIGILGSGNVGATLGTRWAQGGHNVVFSSRKPQSDKMKELVGRAGATAGAATPAETVAASEVVVVATPWAAAKDALTSIGSFEGKIVIDLLNPLLPDLSGLEVGNTTSAGEMVAGWCPGGKVVKAFNTVGFPTMANPVVNGEPVVMLYCGDDAAAKKVVAQLATELGFNAVDAGPLTQARVLEPFALLWISLAYKQGFGTHWGFRIVR